MDNAKRRKTLMALFQGKPCVQDLISFFLSFISENKKISEKMTSESSSRVSNENSDKEHVESKSTDNKEARTQNMRGCEGQRSTEKDIQSKSHDDNEIDNSSELMTCKFCHAQIPLDSYNSHIKENHFPVYSKKVDSDNSDASAPVRKRKQTESETEVNAEKLKRLVADTVTVTALDGTKNDADLSAWRASFIPTPAPAILMYLCKTCTLATAAYDNAVEHAQNHILNLEIKTELCDICNLKFAADFNMHRELHANDDDIDRDSFKYVSYDYTVLMKPEWLNMFDTLPKETGDKIKSASIYFPTRCIRLRLQNDSVDATEKNTLFKCVTCNNYVDPHSVELHINNCSKELVSYLCDTCNRPFVTEQAKIQHSLMHEDSDANKNFRTVLFNNLKHLSFNKKLLHAGGKLVLDKESHETNREGGNKKQKDKTSIKISNDAQDAVTVANRKHKSNSTVEKNYPENLKKTDVYECQCGINFDRLEFLWRHLEICSPVLKLVTTTCKCGLVFDEQNYDYHCEVHRHGFTMFNVKVVSVHDKKSLDVRGMIEEFKTMTAKTACNIINKDMNGNK